MPSFTASLAQNRWPVAQARGLWRILLDAREWRDGFTDCLVAVGCLLVNSLKTRQFLLHELRALSAELK
jgi:hypothetical protein